MNIARRRVLSFLGTVPLVARQAAETAAKQLAGIGSGHYGIMPDIKDALGLPSGAPVSADAVNLDLREAAIRAALKIPALRGELESMLARDNRQVHCLDHDLAANRSFSLAAKVTYQRQRNIQRAIDHDLLSSGSPWNRLRAWGDRIFGKPTSHLT